jgi:hypothetical protein
MEVIKIKFNSETWLMQVSKNFTGKHKSPVAASTKESPLKGSEGKKKTISKSLGI